MKNNKKAAAVLSAGLLAGTLSGAGSVSALNAEDVLNDTLDDLQNTLVDYIFIKNYISGNISLSADFKTHLDYNKDNVVNILDANHAKQKILKMMETEDKPPVTSVTPAVTTPPVTGDFKTGDMVSVNGTAYAKADGTGNSVPVNGTYEISNVLPAASYKCNIQLKGIGWISPAECKAVSTSVTTSVTAASTPAPVTTTVTSASTQAPVTTAVTSVSASAPVTTVANTGNLKVGDRVSYNGKAYAKADGTGNNVSVNGEFEITNILPASDYKYNIQLKNTGWVAYSDIVGSKLPDTPQNYDDLKKGDTVQFTGKAYMTASGSGTPVEVSGRYEVINILTPTDTYKYTVQLKNVGWVSYKELTGRDQQTTPAVTTVTTVTAAPVTTSAENVQGNLKVGDKVKYSGKAYYSASGTGTNIDVNGEFKIKEIITNTNLPYTVQLEGAGWVAYKDVAGVPQQTTAVTTVTTAPVTTVSETTSQTTVTSAVQSGNFKAGDTVSYKGKVYYAASGAGRSIDVDGTFKIQQILDSQTQPYTVLLEGAGWVAYKDLTGVQITTPAVTTTAPVTTPQPQVTTTAPQSQNDQGELKTGDTVKYKGTAYYSASGNGSSVEVDGTFRIKEIVSASTGYPYTVQLEGAGWVAYKDVAGTVQPGKTEAAVADGEKYNVVNVSSGRYLTAGGTDNRSNIYQDDRSNGTNQTFKIAKYSYSDTYRFFIESTSGKVIDIVKDSSAQVANGCNVQLYEAVDPDAQTWKIEQVSEGKFKIVSVKNESLALTSNGNQSGSQNGKDTSSEGNIFISEYTGSNNQLWYLEKTN